MDNNATASPAHADLTDASGQGPVFVGSGVTLYQGDSLRLLRSLPDASVDSVVTDPPYAMKSGLDSVRTFLRDPSEGAGSTCRQCAAPATGRFVLCAKCLVEVEVDAYAGASMLGMQSQNWHERATHSRGYADNDNGQFGRWCYLWAKECHRILKPGGHLVAFGGTRTWHRLAVAVEDAGFEIRDSLAWLFATGFPKSMDIEAAVNKAGGHLDGPTTPDGAPGGPWKGWGTALKPAHEPIVLARKRPEGTVASNVVEHGTGGLNIDACRVQAEASASSLGPRRSDGEGETGRWPTNVLLDRTRARELDHASSGVSSRSLWAAKPDQSERVRIEGVSHPTVKPLSLMQELVRLVTPAAGVVLEPFAGSGTTVEACLLEGFNCIAIEKDAAYLPLIRQRIDRRRDPLRAVRARTTHDPGLFDL